MRSLAACVLAVFVGVLFVGCAQQEEKDKVHVQAPGVDVRKQDDGKVRVKAPFVDIQTDH